MGFGWVKRIPIFPLLIAYIFLTSSFIVSSISMLLLVVWPFSKGTYRWLVSQISYSLFGQFVWMAQDWAGVKVTLFGEKEVYDHLGKECALWTLSHRGDLDWVIGYVVGYHYNFIHRIRTLPKKSVFYVPGFGQLLWATECTFLSRSFAKDEANIKKMSDCYKDSPFPVQVCIFCEGTRFTEAKYLSAVKFARERGLKEFKHHLYPRTKGFAVLAENLKHRAEFQALYNVTFAYPNCKTPPTFLDLLLGRPFEMYFYFRRIPMSQIPSTREELTEYCIQLYQQKDDAYEHFVQKGEFPAPRQPFPPTYHQKLLRLRVMMFCWAVLLVGPWVWFFVHLASPMMMVEMTVAGFGIMAVIVMCMLIYSRPAGSKKLL